MPTNSQLAQRTTEANAAPAQVKPADAIKQAVERYRPVIRRALPSHVSEDQFVSTILTAVRNEPKLLQCDPASLCAAAVRAAQLGLAPNDGRGLAAIIPYGREATYQTMYKGAIELARRSGAVRRIVARTVYEADRFDFAYGTEGEHLTHVPTTSARGEAVNWYAIAWAPDGALLDFVVLTKADIEYHRSFSRQPNGNMWGKSYDAAARKTAVWELLKLLPQSVEMALAMSSDDRALRLTDDGPEPDEEPEPIGDARQVEHAGAIESGLSEQVDPVTGEVTEVTGLPLEEPGA